MSYETKKGNDYRGYGACIMEHLQYYLIWQKGRNSIKQVAF